MRRVFNRLALISSATVALAVFLLLFAIHSLNKRQAYVAQNMMDDAARLVVGKSSFEDVLAYAHRYNAETTGSWHQNPCTEADCLVTADVHTDDFAQRHPKLGSLPTRISRRYWGFITLMWVKDGKLDGIRQWFWYVTPTRNAAVITDTSRPSSKLCHNPFFRLHRSFVAFQSAKHFEIWVDSAAASERQMLRLNLGCASSIRGCRDVAEMAPIAWTMYESDRPLVDSAKWSEAAQDDNCR
jgi:hypothetical protein